MAQYIVTGSSTASGQPLYLSGDRWQASFAEASLVEDSDQADAAVAHHRTESQAVVCDPYAIEVELDGGSVRPTTLKESIRAKGPTVPYA